jgi:hypothetical protein
MRSASVYVIFCRGYLFILGFRLLFKALFPILLWIFLTAILNFEYWAIAVLYVAYLITSLYWVLGYFSISMLQKITSEVGFAVQRPILDCFRKHEANWKTRLQKQRNSSWKTKRLNYLCSQGYLQQRHSEYNVKLRFSRHWSNVNASCDVVILKSLIN